ncbi:MAG TPA: hypothetical protein PLV68_09210, partial [Ilumatobacteraceae bacterium]|nr:hypothetical protein [Ilumatobacteraceae bacterium]
IAAITSRALLGLRSAYFLMATVALNGLVGEATVVFDGLTGGPHGIIVAPWVRGTPTHVYLVFYYAMAAAVVVIGTVSIIIRRSRLGVGLMAIKGNEDAADAFGVPTQRYKTAVWITTA